MATTIKGPAIFLAQFAGDAAPFNSWTRSRRWAAGLGFKGVQIPSWDARLFDLKKAADVEDLLRRARRHRARTTASRSPSSATHLQGQLVAVHPAYDEAFDGFAPAAGARQPEGAPGLGGRADAAGRRKASQQPRADSARAAFPGALAWPYLYPVAAASGRASSRAAFDELAQALAADPRRLRRSRRATSASSCTRAKTCTTATTFELFLERVEQPSALLTSSTTRRHFVLQQLDYLAFIDIYHERIKVVPCEGRGVPADRAAGRVLAATSRWVERAGRFRSLGDGQIDFERDLLEDGAVRLTRLGGARMGVRAEASRGRRARRRASSSATTSSASPRGRSTTSPAAARSGAVSACSA